MKRFKYFLICALALPLFFSQGCSDNVDADLEPIKTEHVLTIQDPKDQKVSFGAAPSNYEVKFATNTRWAVKVECDGGWCTVDKYSGSGDGSFTISVLENLSEYRECKVILMMTDAKGEQNGDSRHITITQEASNVHLTPSSLEPFPAHAASRQDFSIVANAAWTLSVEYDTPEAGSFVTVTPESGMTAEGAGFKGNGAAKFQISLSDNNSTATRLAYLTLRSEVSSYSVEIRQLGSDYSFSVSPSEIQRAAARGDTIPFGVLSLSEWKVSSDALWIDFTKTSGAGGVEKEITEAIVAPNASVSARTARILFSPVKEGYSPVEVVVVQEAVRTTFAVSNNPAEFIPVDGGTASMHVYSAFDWTVVCPGWVTPSVSEGSADGELTLTFDRNSANTTRDALIRIVPQTTDIDGVTIDPQQVGVTPIECFVTQMGGNVPAISVPWLSDGYGQTSVTVNIQYYSPFHTVTKAGIKWRLETESAWQTVVVPQNDSKEGTVSVNLTGLTPATRYVARGFVIDSDGNVTYGSVSLPFTTAGQRPGAGDNPTPEP